MTAAATSVDLSRLPPPDVIEVLDFETIFAALRADFLARFPEFSANVESDPIIKLLQVFAYRELVLRARINDAARSVLVAYAADADLDNIAALFGVARQQIAPANPITGAPAIFEDDVALRRRVLLAPDSFSVAGPASAYVFHALSADADVLDASAISPRPGEVTVTILSRSDAAGAPAPEVLAAVRALLAGDEVRPLTDSVTVAGAESIEFDIDAQLFLYPGPDEALMLSIANAGLDELLSSSRRLGRDITRSAIIAALHVAGVQNVILNSPVSDIIVEPTQIANVAARSVSVAGFGS
jgi:phage-related baseplate assembly protein